MHRPGAQDSLVEFAFESRASPDLPAAAYLRIARQSWSFNTRSGLTGVLRFADGRFEQVVEGCCTVVLPLATRILGDARHAAISVTAFRPLAARRFAHWTLSGFDLELPSMPPEAANLVYLAPLAAVRGAVPAPAHGAVVR
jgi:FAD-dependent sensor of blue light